VDGKTRWLLYIMRKVLKTAASKPRAMLDPLTLPGEDETISEMWCPVLGQEGCGKPERVLGIMTYGERLRELGWFSLEKSLGNGQIIRQRAIHRHEVHFRKVMVDVKRIFSTQMLT